jgi:hypothetical protein
VAVFALEDGRLVAAQSYDLQGTELARESLAAIRERVIDLLGRTNNLNLARVNRS